MKKTSRRSKNNFRKKEKNQKMNIMEQYKMMEELKKEHKCSYFKEVVALEVELPTGDRLKIPFNSEKMLKTFDKELKKKIENINEKDFVEQFTKDKKETVEYVLKNIFELKREELDVKIREEYYIRKPLNKVEKMDYKAIVKNIANDIFAEENVVQVLLCLWLRTAAIVLDDS